MAGGGGTGRRFVQINEAAIKRISEDPGGPLFEYVDTLASEVQKLATDTAPRYAPPHPWLSQGTLPGPPLAETIEKRVFSSRSGPKAFVGSESEKAWAVHEGTEPHLAPTMGGGPILRFYGTKVGAVVTIDTRVTPVGMHPGGKPNPWIRRAMEQVLGLPQSL